MLAILGTTGLGILILVITSILMTKRDQPFGCMIYFGSLFFFGFVALLIGPNIVMAG